MANVGGDFSDDFLLTARIARVADRWAKFAIWIRKAAITVTPGAGQMIINMNGRDYVLRGAEADQFRKEYVAIPRPEAKVNALVEKYMNALQPLKKQTVPVAPGVVEKEKQQQRGRELVDAENYWAGKGAPTPQEEKRYVSSKKEVAGYIEHKEENKGQAPDVEPLTAAVTGDPQMITVLENAGWTPQGGGFINFNRPGEKMLVGQHEWRHVREDGGMLGKGFSKGALVKWLDMLGKGAMQVSAAEKIAQYLDDFLKGPGHKTGDAYNTRATAWTGEMNDHDGVEDTDLSKMGAVAEMVEVGDEVRVNRGHGSFLRGTVQKVLEDGIVVRNQKFPFSAVQTEEEVEESKTRGKHQWEEEGRQRQQVEQEEMDKFRQELVKKFTQSEATGTYDQLANYLMSAGYTLKLDVSDDQLEEFSDKYHELTGEELNATSRPKSEAHAKKGGWTVVFKDTPEVRQYLPWPVDFERTGLLPRSGEGNERAVTNGKNIKVMYNRPVWELIKRGLRYTPKDDIQEVRTSSMSTKQGCDSTSRVDEEVMLPDSKAVPEGSEGQRQLPPAATALPEKEKEAGFNFFFPGQVTEQFYPEIMHELVDYPNADNSPMIEDIDITASLDAALNTSIISAVHQAGYDSNFVSTSPVGGIGIGRDGKPEVLDGAPLRKENDIRGWMFEDEFHQQYEGVPGAALAVVSKKVAATDELRQFELFLKKVCGEIAATFVALFKVTGHPPFNQVPGIGEVQLAQLEQSSTSLSSLVVNTGSRVRYLLDQLNSGDVREAVTKARAQAAVWLDDPSGGFVYEVFVRAESIDTDSMVLKYKFIIGSKESE